MPKGKTGKLTHTYLDDYDEYLVKDYQGHVVKESAMSSVHLEPASFELSVAGAFKEFLQGLADGYIIIEKNTPAKGV